MKLYLLWLISLFSLSAFANTSITISSPVTGVTYPSTQGSVTLTGTNNPAHGGPGSLTCSGIEATFTSQKSWSVEIPLQTGTNNITCTFTKNKKSASSTISLQKNALPVASFIFNPNAGLIAPETVSFDASGSSDSEGAIGSFAWDFGDGTTGPGSQINHTYSEAGTYSITLTVTDSFGESQTKTETIEIIPNVKPVASFTMDKASGHVPLTVNFNATLSSDSDGQVTQYIVNFGDGSGEQTFSSATFSHLYQTAGNLSVSLKVKDNKGGVSEPVTLPLLVRPEDHTPPFIQLGVQDNVLTNDPNFILPVSVADASPTKTKVWHNGINIYEGEETSFDRTIILNEGINLFSITSVDTAGNESSVHLSNIILDTVAPELSSLNIAEGSSIREQIFNLQGSANEKLSAILVNQEIPNLNSDGQTFTYLINHGIAGPQILNIQLTDLAGNSSQITRNYELSLKILEASLISVIPNDKGGLTVLGQPGAAKPGVEIEVSDGFFNSGEAVVAENGSFQIEMDPFSSATVKAFDSQNDREEEVIVTFSVDTTFAGIVKDINDNPLPGVTIRIVSSGQSATTDASGVFAISNPILGDQAVIVDGTTIPEAITNGTKEFSRMTINVNLGKLQQNVLDRPLYMTPKYLDGSETQVENGQTTIVESPHAPGVRLEIPANAVIFPSGATEGSINMVEIPVERSSIEILEEAAPDTVVALEPSGLKFSERVKVTLPNVNEFPEGMELVILSKNSESGEWEVDGGATVNENGDVETKEGMGISHFSEIYAAPMGLELKRLGDGDKPAVDSFSGAVTSSIGLPSFKVMGQDLAPGLIYNSTWSNPNVVVSNVFDLPTKKLVFSGSQTSGNAFGVGKATVSVQQTMKPEYINARFSSGSVNSRALKFKGLASKAVVSYQMNLGALDSGVYPARSSYEVRYKAITIKTTKVKTRNFLGQVKTKKKKKTTIELLDAIFPPELLTSLYIQNKSESEFGRGWHLGMAKKIVNPGNDRLLLENENGTVSPYVIKNTIETVVQNQTGIDTFAIDNDRIIFAQGKNVFYSQNGQTTAGPIIPTSTASLGVNLMWYNGKYDDGRFFWRCQKSIYNEEVLPDVSEIISTGQGVFLLDSFQARLSSIQGSSVVNYNNNLINLPSVLLTAGAPNGPVAQRPNFSSYCQSYFNHGCSNLTYNNLFLVRHPANNVTSFDRLCNLDSDNTSCMSGTCTYSNVSSSGKIYQTGYNTNNFLSSARFNTPKAMAVGPNNTLLIADYGNNIVRKVNFATGGITPFAGNRSTYNNGDGGLATSASIYHPTAVATDSLGNAYIASENGLIRKVGTDGIIRAFAGKASGGILDDDYDDITQIMLNRPGGLAIDNTNQYLYVADTGHHRVLRIDLINLDAKTVAGNYSCDPNDTFDGKSALETSICSPEKMALDTNGNLLILDETKKRIRRVNFQVPSSGLTRFSPVAKDNSEIIRNADGDFVLLNRDGTEVLFSNEGLHLSTVDRVGRTTSFEYDTSKRLTKMILPTSQEVLVNYSGDKLASITDPAGRVTEFEFDGHDLSEVNYPDGTSKAFVYNEDGVLVEETNQRGSETQYELNQWNRLKKIIRPGGSFITMDDAVSKTIANNNDDNNPDELKSFGTDQDSLKDVLRDAKGNETVFLKDTNGYVQTIIDAEGKTTTIERDNEGRPTKIIKPDLTYTQLTYDQVTGDLLQRFESESNTTESYTYNQYGQLLSYTDPLGRTKTNTYDAQTGLLLRETDPNLNYVDYTYNNFGLIQATANTLGHTTTYAYNREGNVAQVTAPMTETSTFTRDNAGNVLTKTNAKGQVTTYTYDLFNRLKTVKTARNHTTTYNYLASGELGEIVNPEGFSTLFEYDQLGRLIQKTSPKGQETTLFYDNNDNITKEVSPNGDIKLFGYDVHNRLIRKTLPDNIYEFEYDDKGNLVAASNNSSEMEMTYTSILGRDLVETVTTTGAGIPSHTLSYGYNGSGKLTSMSSGYLNLAYALDAGYRLIGVQNSLSQSFGFDYDNANRLTSITRPNSINSTMTYDNNSFLTQYLHKQGSTTIESLVYTRDQIGNRTSLTTSRGTQSYTYDNDNQLLTATHPEADALHQLESFTYDSLGNRTSDNQGSYNYDNKKYRLDEDYKFIYAYDQNGNLISKQEKGLNGKVWNYSYSSENQMVLVEFFDGSTKLKSVSFTYDVQGRRIKKSVDDIQNSVNYERKYIYDGPEIIAELNEDNSVLAKYTHSGLRTDDVLSVEVTSAGVAKGYAPSVGSYNYLKDGLGSIQAIASSSGNIIQRYVYSSFGKLIKVVDDSGASITPVVNTAYTYTNRELDSETGLYYYRARYYDANSGRFMQEDPYSGEIIDPSSHLSKYSYVSNSPTRYNDPWGLYKLEDLFKDIKKIGDGTIKVLTSREAQVVYGTVGGIAIIYGGVLLTPINPQLGATAIATGTGLAVGSIVGYARGDKSPLETGAKYGAYAGLVTAGAALGATVAAGVGAGSVTTFALTAAGTFVGDKVAGAVGAHLGNDTVSALFMFGATAYAGTGATGGGSASSTSGGSGGNVYVPSF